MSRMMLSQKQASDLAYGRLLLFTLLEQQDVITVAATGSGKSLTNWMALLYIKYGIVLLVTPLKLLGKQFVEVLTGNKITAVSMTAANATNQLFKVRSISTYYKLISKCMDRILAKGLTNWSLSALSCSLMMADSKCCGGKKSSLII